MKIVYINREFSKIILSRKDFLVLNSALNEICNGIDTFEFDTRIGESYDYVLGLLKEIGHIIDEMDSVAG